MIKRLIKDKSGAIGDMVIVIPTAIICLMMLLFIFMGGIGAMIEYSKLNSFANELIKEASECGMTSSSEIDARYEELSQATGLQPEHTLTSKTGKNMVQYGDTINLNMTLNTEITGFAGLSTPITFNIEKTAKSKQYFKE